MAFGADARHTGVKWYARWLADYAGKTAGLSMIEHGAYTLLLDHYYQIENALPLDREPLYRICRAMEQTERQAVDRVIEQFFTPQNGALHNAKCDKVIATAREHAELQSRKGTAGAEKRWARKHKANGSSAYGSHKAATETVTAKRAAKSSGAQYPEEFELTWKAYPRRDGDNPKVRAFTAYKARLRDGHNHQEIHAGVLRYAAWVKSKGREGTETVKQAATFFGPDKAFLEPWPCESNSALLGAV